LDLKFRALFEKCQLTKVLFTIGTTMSSTVDTIDDDAVNVLTGVEFAQLVSSFFVAGTCSRTE